MMLVATNAFQSSTVNSVKGARRCIPALFTQTSSGPTVSSMWAIPADTAAGSVTSKGTACTTAPVALLDLGHGHVERGAVAGVDDHLRAGLGPGPLPAHGRSPETSR